MLRIIKGVSKEMKLKKEGYLRITPNKSTGLINLPIVVTKTTSSIKFKIHDIVNAIKNFIRVKVPNIDKINNKMLMNLPSIAVKIII